MLKIFLFLLLGCVSCANTLSIEEHKWIKMKMEYDAMIEKNRVCSMKIVDKIEADFELLQKEEIIKYEASIKKDIVGYILEDKYYVGVDCKYNKVSILNDSHMVKIHEDFTHQMQLALFNYNKEKRWSSFGYKINFNINHGTVQMRLFPKL